MSVESAFSSVESALPRPKRKAFTAALLHLRGETESEEDDVNRAVFGAQTFTKGTPFTLPLKVRKSCLFEKFCLYTRSGQIPVIHVELTPATHAAIVEHGQNCRDAVEVPVFGPPHPDDGPGVTTMTLVPAQPHPHVFQLAWNLAPPVNTDSTEAMKDMLQAHGIPVPKWLGEDADERRFSVNELMERYICHRNWQWHHDKTVWPAWAKALESNQLRALNSYRVTILSTLQRRYRLFLGRAVNVRFDFPHNMRVACSPYDFALLMTQHALEQRGSENRNVTSVFEDVKDVDLLFPPTMEDTASDGQVHQICGHSVATRWHTAHYDEGDRAMMRTIGDRQVLVNFNKVTFELWVTASWSVYQKKLLDGAAAVWEDVTPGVDSQQGGDIAGEEEGEGEGDGEIESGGED